jgi:hypothetical protein
MGDVEASETALKISELDDKTRTKLENRSMREKKSYGITLHKER